MGGTVIPLISGAFAKALRVRRHSHPEWDDNRIVAISLGTDAYDFGGPAPGNLHSQSRKGLDKHPQPTGRPRMGGAKKIRWLFSQTGGPVAGLVVE